MRRSRKRDGGNSGGGIEIDLNLTGELWGMPGKLTGQVSTADTELPKVLIVALIGLFGVYLERRMTQRAEEKHKYLESQKMAYYNFVTLISKLQEPSYEWNHTTVTELWLAALEAGQYGDLEAIRSRFHIEKDEYLIVALHLK
jgi:hypothetical protein